MSNSDMAKLLIQDPAIKTMMQVAHYLNISLDEVNEMDCLTLELWVEYLILNSQNALQRATAK